MDRISGDVDRPVAVIDDGFDSAGEEKAEWKPTRDFFLALIALCTLSLTVAIDSTTLSVALSTMSAELHGTALQAFWSGTSFLLASTILQPSMASMSNILGRKYMLYVSSVLFGAGSLIAALAGNFTVVIAGRTIQGLGGGSIIALTEVIITDLVPLAQRGTWFSLLGVMWSIGTVTGPLIGAGFAQNVSWRWIFYINLPILGLGVIFIVLFLHQMKIPGHILEKLGRFDWLGSFLFTVGATSFLFGISVGGVMYDWSSWRTLLPLIIGPFILLGFAVWELRYASEPIISREIFTNWTLISTYIQTVFHGIILWSLLYFLVLFYQGVKLYTPVISAVAVLPETLTVAPSSMVVGILSAMFGKVRWAIWSGWSIATLGAGIMYLLGPHSSIPQWVFLNLPIGLGTGMLFPAMALGVQSASPPALNGQAAAFFSFLRTFGQSLGVAISGVIFQNAFRQKLNALPAFKSLASQYSQDATAVIEIIKGMPSGEPKTQLIQAYSDALRDLWLSLLAFAAVAMILGFTIKSYSLNQEHVTKQGLRTAADTTLVRSDIETGDEGEKKEENRQ